MGPSPDWLVVVEASSLQGILSGHLVRLGYDSVRRVGGPERRPIIYHGPTEHLWGSRGRAQGGTCDATPFELAVTLRHGMMVSDDMNHGGMRSHAILEIIHF